MTDVLDCGDHSCRFAKNQSGMRTNGGCRCLKSIDEPLRLRIHATFHAVETERDDALRLNGELRAALDRDKTGLAKALCDIQDEVKGRRWIREGRGPYTYDDDRYRQETGFALDAIQKIATDSLTASGKLAHETLTAKPYNPDEKCECGHVRGDHGEGRAPCLAGIPAPRSNVCPCEQFALKRVASSPKEAEKVVQDLYPTLKALSDEERHVAFDGLWGLFCRTCYRLLDEGRKCHCWNDE